MGAVEKRIFQAAVLIVVLSISYLQWTAPTSLTRAALRATSEPHWGVELVGPVVPPPAEAGPGLKPSVIKANPPPFSLREPQASQDAVSHTLRTDQEKPSLLVLPLEEQGTHTALFTNVPPVLHSKQVGVVSAGFKRRRAPSEEHSLPQPWYLRIETSTENRPQPHPWSESFDLEANESEITLSSPSPMIIVGNGVFAALVDMTKEQFMIIGAEGFAPQAVMMQSGQGRRENPLRLTLKTGGRLRVQTTPGNHLTLQTPLCALGDNVPQLTLSWTMKTDESGWIAVDDLPRNVPLGMDWVPSSPHAPTQIECTGEAPVVLNLARLGGHTRLSGNLTDPQGNALPHTTLWLMPATRKASVHLAPQTLPLRRLLSDELGHFHLENLPAAAWWICPAPGYGWAPVTRWFEVPPDGKEIHLDLEAVPARAVAGRVMDEENMPVAGAMVRLMGDNGKVLAQRLSSQEGGFAFEAPTGSRLAVQSLASGSHSSSKLIPCPMSSQPLRLQVQRGGQIHGVFLTENNSLSQGPHQVLLHSPDQAPKMYSLGGALFSLDGLAQGRHALAVLDTLGRVGTLVVDIGEESTPPATILLGLGQTTAVHNPTMKPLRCTLTAEGVVWLRTTLDPGATRTVAIPTAPLEVHCSAPGQELVRSHSFVEQPPEHISLEMGS